MQTHNIRIYTADAALQTEDTMLTSLNASPGHSVPDKQGSETTLAHFCAFIDFYTRKAADPLNTSLACEKQAEAVEITDQDVTPENLRLLMDTLLEAIDHLEKKWLDEQIKHEDRQRKHREDVARLYRQLRELQPESSKSSHFYQKGRQLVHNLLFRRGTRSGGDSPSGHKPSAKSILSKRAHRPIEAAHA